METDLLRTFVEVSRQGSVTAAAEVLGYTQSAVSRQVASLEAAVGARLLDRRPRGVTLTEAGRSLLPHAHHVLARLGAAQSELESLGRLEIGHLRVGGFPTANAALVPATLAQLREEHPGLEVSLVEGTTARQLSLLESGDVDLAVVSAFADQTLAGSRYDLDWVVDDPILVAMHSGHPLARRRQVRLRDLTGERWIGEDHADDRLLSPRRLGSGSGLEADLAVREWTAKLGLTAAGLGVTLVPRLAAVATRADLCLVDLHPSENATRRVYAASSATRARSRAAAAFVAALQGQAARLWGASASSPRGRRPAPRARRPPGSRHH